MFSRAKAFLSRHKRKFLVGGAVGKYSQFPHHPQFSTVTEKLNFGVLFIFFLSGYHYSGGRWFGLQASQEKVRRLSGEASS